jgi:FKBP-type peptidyl-prolyl cis-trans isomerase FkpA
MSSVIPVHKRLAAGLAAILVTAPMAGPALGEGQVAAETGAVLATDRDRLSYAMGMDLGGQLRRSGVNIDPAIFGRALGDALSGGQTQLTPDEARQEIGRLQAEMMRRQVQARGQAQPGQAPGAGQGQAPAPTPNPAGTAASQ